MSKTVPTVQKDESVWVDVNSDKYVDDHGRMGQLSTSRLAFNKKDQEKQFSPAFSEPELWRQDLAWACFAGI